MLAKRLHHLKLGGAIEERRSVQARLIVGLIIGFGEEPVQFQIERSKNERGRFWAKFLRRNLRDLVHVATGEFLELESRAGGRAQKELAVDLEDVLSKAFLSHANGDGFGVHFERGSDRLQGASRVFKNSQRSFKNLQKDHKKVADIV